ncbi:MAG: arylsulfatase [Luteolibacter sp.]|uniref:arylsulfatase n=1 Tax=Luteolibacter sp. TaxID=1962973 RepID=UPI0032631203
MKAILIALATSLPAILTAADAAKPNILVVLIDDLGYSDLGCYGGEIPTPNIDSLAKTGLRYTGMTNSARCCPSRASLLTGLHPAQAGIPDFDGSLSDDSATLAEVARGAGYATYAVGKWHVGADPKSIPTARGFDAFFGFPNGHSQGQWNPAKYKRLPEGHAPELGYKQGEFYATDVFSDYALEFIKQGEASKKPWLLYLAYSSPHFPLQAPKGDVKPFLETYRKGWDVLREERFKRMKSIGLADTPGWKLTERSVVPIEQNNAIANGYSGKQNPAWDTLPADRREDLAHRMAIYAAMVKHVDDGVGRIVNQLKSAGKLDNTLILLLSDNGACYEWGPFGFDGASRAGNTTLHEGAALDKMGAPGEPEIAYGSGWANLCNTPFKLYKHFAHQGGIATPLIVHWPAGVSSPDRWVRDPAHVIDIMATLVDVAHAGYPKTRAGTAVLPMEGVSLAPTFKPGGKLEGRSICYQHEGSKAIRKGDWKLVMGAKLPSEAWELYNLNADPCETQNLASGKPELVASLADEWQQWAIRTGLHVKQNNPANGIKKGKRAKPNTEDEE